MKLILASKSPRRSELLTKAGIPFTIRTADTEEIYPDTLDVLEVAPYLAKLKADGAKHLLQNEDELLLTADSVVILNGKIYGKPKDRADAIATLHQLSGQQHTVVTGCCLMDGTRHEVFSGVSEVYLNEMTDREIEKYVDVYEPYDKAGSYAIQEWVGLAKIHRIEGTYPNIMGLPVDLVYERWINWDR
ncbi:Maf family nucleotide pyrophosphatase [Lewinella sp. 4G2]|uniref:Maf family nucleotide pyrophosphatase n=1 Tax=Lewinella sp. 4G2 TaxID=1803372 RepID=UPI0007B46825|nr:Maf family nucleotide pyrophosphatase [Lewinella sp. 4G2]OAV44659.1 septum formation protein Maf [Lewinella sp. 4G2]